MLSGSQRTGGFVVFWFLWFWHFFLFFLVFVLLFLLFLLAFLKLVLLEVIFCWRFGDRLLEQIQVMAFGGFRPGLW